MDRFRSSETGVEPQEHEKRTFSEQAIREFLETHHSVDDAGTKGIIFKFTRNDIPPALQETLLGNDEDSQEVGTEQALAIKILKIFNSGDAELEYDALKRAQEITANEPRGSVAHAPRATGYYELAISPDLEQFLNQNGAVIAGGKIGVIVMDYIAGEDLATILYKKALLHVDPERKIYPDEQIDDLTFSELHNAVAAGLGFSKPGKKSRDEGERNFEETEIQSENVKKLIRTLKKGGFELPQALLDQIQKTIDLYHGNGLFHNDLHERNIILKNSNLENPEPFIVDFGSATIDKKASEQDNVKVTDDSDLVRRLTPLVHQKDNANGHYLKDLAEVLKKQPQWKKRSENISAALTKGNGQLEREFLLSSGNDRELEGFLALLLESYEGTPAHRDAIEDFVKSQKSMPKARGFLIKKLVEWENEASGK